ncbi:MAG: hypothetical protein QXT86_10440 [Archaeoglobaceae archaeon]
MIEERKDLIGLRELAKILVAKDYFYIGYDFAVFFWFIPEKVALMAKEQNGDFVIELVRYVFEDAPREVLFVFWLAGRPKISDLLSLIKSCCDVFKGILFWREKKQKFEYIKRRG